MRYCPTAQSSPANPASFARSRTSCEVVGEPHANTSLGGGFAREAGVLDAEGDGGAGMRRRVEDGLAVVLVKLRLEQRAVDGLMKERGIDALRFGVDESLGEGLVHRGDHEVAAQLERVRLPRLAGDDGEAAADGFQQPAGLARAARLRRR